MAPKKLITRSLVTQSVLLFLIVSLVVLAGIGLVNNLKARGIPLGFDFLARPAGFNMSETVLAYDPSVDPYWWAALVGLGNTIYLSLIVIALSTVLGTIIAIGRLSNNSLASAVCRVWIELARNTPPIILLFLIYSMWWKLLPQISEAWSIGSMAHISLRGLVYPKIIFNLPTAYYVLLVLTTVISFLTYRNEKRKRIETGQRSPIFLIVLVSMFALLMLAGYFLGIRPQIDVPVKAEGYFTGGSELSPEFTSIVIGLTIYTTGFVAEIVRAGILAIPKGQWEAARSVGLNHFKILRLVILPQTLRVIIPPMTSQYINVIKNSTLAIAIGYMDFLTVMQTVINTSNHAIEGLLIILFVYLVVNLGLSALMNRWNSKMLRTGNTA